MTHECPGRGCIRQVPPNRLACPGCWFQLPAGRRGWLNDAYRARGSDPQEHRRALASALEWYRENPVRIP